MKALLLFFMIAILAAPAAAFDGSTGSGNFDFRQKSTAKDGSRWTLQDWLAQKERNHMMDLWLSMYSPSPYEFFIGGAYEDFNTVAGTDKTHVTSGMASAGAYATIVGLEGFYENDTQEKRTQSGGSVNLRIAGNAVQGTHLSVNYGYRSLNTSEGTSPTVVNQTFAGADLNMYLTRYFGLSGAYRYYIPVSNDILGTVSGNRAEAGAFIDFAAVRVFGTWFQDIQNTTPNQVDTEVNRTGIMGGLKFFF